VVKSKKIDEREPVYFLVIKSNFFDHKKREWYWCTKIIMKLKRISSFDKLRSITPHGTLGSSGLQAQKINRVQ
jgi:hypothetical protein